MDTSRKGKLLLKNNDKLSLPSQKSKLLTTVTIVTDFQKLVTRYRYRYLKNKRFFYVTFLYNI